LHIFFLLVKFAQKFYLLVWFLFCQSLIIVSINSINLSKIVYMMKKTLLLLVTLAFAMVASGQRIAPNPHFSNQPVKGKYEFKSTHESTQRDGKLINARSQKAPARVDIITEQPEGELKTYVRSGYCMYSYWGYIFATTQDGMAMQIVFAEDGKTVYLQDPIAMYTDGVWVKAELSEDGKTITMPLFQYLGYWDAYGYGIITAWVDVTVEDGYLVYQTNMDKQEVTYTLGDDGTITLNGTSGNIDTYEASGLAIIYDDDMSWTSYLDWESVYTPFEANPVVAPDEAVFSNYSMSYVQDGAPYGKMVQAAKVGDDFYIKGFSSYVPDGIMKGTVNGDKAIFPSNQYLGVGSGYFLSMTGCDEEGSPYENLEFDYNAETTTLTSSQTLGVVTNSAIAELYNQPVFGPYIDHAATPANPSVLGFSDAGSIDGYNYGQFSIPTVDVDGNFIDPNDLYYRIYFDDDELFTFGPDEYPYVEEYMTDVPYNYTEGYDFGQGGSYIYFYETGFQRVGIQSVFKGGGEEHVSDIVYYTLKEDVAPEGSADHYAGYCDDNSKAVAIGEGRAQGYDVAIYVNDASLKGMKVKGLRISAPSNTTVAQYDGWLSTTLELAMVDGVKTAVADITSNVGAVANGHAEVMFDEPYEVGDDGFFAGYTIPVTEDQYPLMITSDNLGGGLWLHTTKALRNWTDMSGSGSACIELILEGQAENAATIIIPANIFAKKGEPIYVKGTLYNHGTTTLRKAQYTYTLNGSTGTGTLDDYISGDHWGRSSEVVLELPALDATGAYPLTVTTTLVNEVENQDVNPTHEGTVNILEFVPVHCALVEEYTGTWCGWCVRGLVAMELLAETYGDDFIGVAYHNGDPMEIMSSDYYPNDVAGFPSAFVDRTYDVDPYHGFAEEGFGMKDLVDYVMSELALADINITADWADESQSEVNVNVESKFVMNDESGNYALEVMLIEDDMYGEAGTDWDQHNYYPNYVDYYGDEPNLGPLCYMPETIEGYHFNDVLVATSGVVDNSLPASIVANASNNFEYSFFVDNIYNTSYEPLIQNKEKLHVVAIIVDKSTGKVINAAKANVGSSAVTELSDNDKVVDSTIYFDLTGRMVAEPTSGIYVKVVRYTDGSQRSFKVLKK